MQSKLFLVLLYSFITLFFFLCVNRSPLSFFLNFFKDIMCVLNWFRFRSLCFYPTPTFNILCLN